MGRYFLIHENLFIKLFQKSGKISLIHLKCQHHRDLEGGGFHLEKNSYPLTMIKLPIWAIFQKNHTCKFTKPGSIMDAKHTVGSSHCLSPRYLQTHKHTQSNYIAAPTLSKLILPSPSLGTQPQCTSKD